MFFSFKPRVLNIDCFTNNLGAFELFPIDYTHKFFPEWWKKLPKKLSKNARGQDIFWHEGTLKTCVGFNSFYNNGITIPLWTDMAIRKTGTSIDIKLSDSGTILGGHRYEQMEGCLDKEKYAVVKLITPWLFNCKDNVNFAFIQNTWSLYNPDDIIIPPGIVDYKYQPTTNINFFVNFTKQENILLNSGQPLVNIVPLSDRKLKIHTHLVTDEEFHKRSARNAQTAFSNRFQKIKKIVDNKESKSCPFHF